MKTLLTTVAMVIVAAAVAFAAWELYDRLVLNASYRQNQPMKPLPEISPVLTGETIPCLKMRTSLLTVMRCMKTLACRTRESSRHNRMMTGQILRASAFSIYN